MPPPPAAAASGDDDHDGADARSKPKPQEQQHHHENKQQQQDQQHHPHHPHPHRRRPRHDGHGPHAPERTRPRAAAYAPASQQTAARLAMCGFAGDPAGYDAVLARVRVASEAYERAFSGVLLEAGDGSGSGGDDDEGRRDTRGALRQAALHARAAFHHDHAQNPFACSLCWLLPGACICRQLAQLRTPLPPRLAAPSSAAAAAPPAPAPSLRVVVHAHHSEWRRASSTGCLAPLVLASGGGDEEDGDDASCPWGPSVQCLMAGHAPHDARLQALVRDRRWQPVLLFPRREKEQKGRRRDGGSGEEEEEEEEEEAVDSSPPANVSAAEAVAMAAELGRGGARGARGLPLLLIVPDGTWQQARRLSLQYAPGGKYHDPRLRFLELDSESVAALAARGSGSEQRPRTSSSSRSAAAALASTSTQHQRTVSLLAPARLYRGAFKCPQRVSTAEALAAALEALEAAARAREVEEGEGSADPSPPPPLPAADALIRAVQLKVQAVRRQSGKSVLPLP